MKRCQEMFKKWLKTENASWDQLLEALRSPSFQCEYLANQIKQKLVGKCANKTEVASYIASCDKDVWGQ